jgi:hypothetical protein
MKTKWIIACIGVLLAAVVGGLWAGRRPAKEVAVASLPQQHPVMTVVETPPLAPPEAIVPPAEPSVEPVRKPQKPLSVQALNPQPSKPPKEPLHDPDARDALVFVGIDPDAEDYWLGAIFDTSLPDKERDDLMEDLNEVGFSDPKNVTADDLPLIASRLQIIDDVLPYADPFMTGHLLEAQKDLANMYAQAAQ